MLVAFNEIELITRNQKFNNTTLTDSKFPYYESKLNFEGRYSSYTVANLY